MRRWPTATATSLSSSASRTSSAERGWATAADSSAALNLFFPDTTTAAERDRLVALLADFDLVAIHEDDVINPARWTAHFGNAASRDRAAASIRECDAYREVRLERADIEDDDWAARTQADLPAIGIGRIIVAPPWEEARVERDPTSRGKVVVVIEPSRGFGTGHHQSTRLCLTLLQNRPLQSRTVIDVGTGSGVLAITAARLGAAYVSAVDVDPEAIENARENIVRNGVAATVEAHVGDLSTLTLAPADVVTANLTGALLAGHAENLMKLLKPGGALIAAGFTVDERERVAAAFAPAFAIVESAEEDDWWGFVLS